MELSLHVVCRAPLASGFALAGVAVDRADDAAACAGQLRRLVAEPEAGVLLVEDTLYAALPAEFRQRLQNLGLPLVMPFPAPRWDLPSEAEAYVLGILRRAIGYRVQAR